MGLYLVKFTMRQHGKQWEYDFYRTDATATAAVAAAGNDALLRSRMQRLHHQDTQFHRIDAYRVPVGDEIIVPSDFDGFVSDTRGTSEDAGAADVVGTSAMVQFRPVAGPGTRKLFLRGLTDASVARWSDGAPRASEQFRIRLNEFINQAATLFEMRRKQRPSEAGVGWYDVATLAPEDGSGDVNTVVTTRGNHTLQPGHTVNFGRAKGFELLGYQGDITVLAVTANTLTIPVRYRYRGDTAAPAGLRVRRARYEAVGLGNVQQGSRLVTFTSRQTGGLDSRGSGKKTSLKQ